MNELIACDRLRRSGIGFDVHRLEAGRPLVLCGCSIPGEIGLAGHSDADVALHAMTDALLATIGAGDIGNHFPPSDPRWRGADSTALLREMLKLVTGNGGRVVQASVTLLAACEALAPYLPTMERKLARLLAVPVDRIRVGHRPVADLGYIGRFEGMAAQASVVVEFDQSGRQSL